VSAIDPIPFDDSLLVTDASQAYLFKS